MKKVLLITSVASMIDQFLVPNIRLLQAMEYEVHVACNFEKGSTCSSERITELKHKLDEWDVTYYQVDFARDVTKISDNLRAYKQIVKNISENSYDLVHGHSPIGGLITRLACRKIRKHGTKVFYTAHGFHFYNGAPLKNWLIYYPVEWFCSFLTDTLITINKEDHARAQKMHAKRVAYVPGVGIDVSKFSGSVVNKCAKREQLGIPRDTVLMLSVGELNENKNHQIVLRAMAAMDRNDVHYMIAGVGDKEEYLNKLASSLGISERVHLLGYRNDIRELCASADIFCFPSYREGLSVALMEAMASGLPCAVSQIRGNTDLIDLKGGVMFEPYDVDSCTAAINKILSSDIKAMGEYNLEKAKSLDIQKINEQMMTFYL